MPGVGSTTARGYGADHQRMRAAWADEIKRTGGVDCHRLVCLMPSRRIQLGEPWDLGHNDDRTRWTGPEHPTCNRSAGGRNGAMVTNGQRPELRHSREW